MSGDSTAEVTFASLQPNDRLVMETGRSVYTFILTDKANRKGYLVGGNVTQPREAVFSGSLEPNRQLWEGGVRAGARATFFLVVPTEMSGFSQVVTSPLLRVKLVRAGTSLA
jgi:hypothetical protein